MGRRPGRRSRREDRARPARPADRGDPQTLRARPPRTRARIRRTGGSTSTPATSPSTPTTSTTPAPSTSRPTSTSPTPSTSTGPSPTAPRPRRPSAPTCRWTPAGRSPSATWPAPRPRSTSSPRAAPAPAAEATATASPPRGRWCCTPTSPPSPCPTGPRCSGRPDGSRKANGWSCSTSSRTGAPTPAPRSPSSPSSTSTAEKTAPGYVIPDRIREHVLLRDRTCVFPWCTRPARGCDVDHITPYDHTADAEGRPQPGPTTTTTWRRCAGSTTASRPTPPGATTWSSPASSSGPAPTATASDATTPAAPHSTHPTRVSRQDSVLPQPARRTTPDHDPAPHPATHRWRGHRHVRGPHRPPRRAARPGHVVRVTQNDEPSVRARVSVRHTVVQDGVTAQEVRDATTSANDSSAVRTGPGSRASSRLLACVAWPST